ncbi:Glycoside hydrolase family 5 protein [Mycena kentingensis (nom. inval.)]|nr:Glycoside hydrolase family 5 protein [Mycena kentingensis (nom. inval.)]
MLFSCLALLSVFASVFAKNIPKGFATTHAGRFELDGAPFYFVGANSYWLPLLTSKKDVISTFKQMQTAGVKVVRTWGFNAINSTELPGALESGLTYYQVWESGDWTLNDGPQGLQRLDTVIEIAAQFDIRIILAFTNNWVGYGGMELYVDHIQPGASNHDIFYTDSRMIASYQRYVRTIVNRYKNSPTIFAWELMNEARCLGDLPQSANCTAGQKTIPNWYKQQSDFIRSLDAHHMITTGGEGHMFFPDGPLTSDYNFNGQAGEDFAGDLLLPNIDFGTYHIYAQLWYPQFNVSEFTEWGLSWIDFHVDAAKKAGKPLVLEEFGVVPIANQSITYPLWVQHALDTKHAIVRGLLNLHRRIDRIMPWQFGALGLSESGGNRLIKYADALIDGASPNDGLAIYSNETIWDIFKNAAKVQDARSR